LAGPVVSGEALLTAPRRSTGPTSVASVLAVAPLAAEPPRRKRIAVSELIESASGPISSLAVIGLDDDVDVAAAIARARALAGDNLDGELEALAEVSAAPLEISIEAASAELARQLGGSAVRRDRSARWVTPPATTTATAPAVVEPAPVREPEAPAPERAAELVQEPVPVTPVSEAAPEPEPEPSADEIHSIDEFDLEDAEHTELGGSPLGSRTLDHGHGAGSPAIDHATLAARLDAQLAAAEAEADADELELASELGLAAQPTDDVDDDGSAHDLSLEEIDDFEILAEADADEEHLLAMYGEQHAPGGRGVHGHVPAARLPSEIDFAARLDLGDESDRHVVSAHESATHHFADEPSDRHADGSGHELDDELPLPDPHADSAVHALAGFDASDEPAADDEHDSFEAGDEPVDDDERDPFAPRPGVDPIFEPDSTDSFTLAGVPTDSLDLETPPPEPRPAPVSREPVVDRGPHRALAASPLPSLYDSPVEDFELEHALEALDVDLDDLAIPHAVTEGGGSLTGQGSQRDLAARPGAARSRSAPALGTGQEARRSQLASRSPMAAPPRAVGTGAISPHSRRGVARLPSDDGVEIDFDEDD
jgi:hypothetical protein